MKAQVSFEAMINVTLLMVILGMIVWSVDSRMPLLSNSVNIDFLSDVCRKIKSAALMSWVEPGTTTFTEFSDFLNISFNGSQGFSLSFHGQDYVCKMFSNEFVNSSFNSVFSFEINNLSIYNEGSRMVLS
ncbi:MAG: hypothetical protein GON13_03265 [Nanoarchaeota archaeon]|nr:hypothetical protein [Nanoarchaeota archaeon]